MHDQTLVVAVQHQRPELSIILVQQLDAKLNNIRHVKIHINKISKINSAPHTLQSSPMCSLISSCNGKATTQIHLDKHTCCNYKSMRSTAITQLINTYPESMSLKPEPFTAGSFPLLQDQSTTNHNEIIELKLFISFLDQMNQDITCLW